MTGFTTRGMPSGRGGRVRVGLAALACAALACAALLGGCATTRPGQETPTGLVVSPVTTASTAASTASVSLPPAPPLPAGSQWITSAGHGVKFAVPSDWTMFDLTQFTSPNVRAALEPVAKRLGKTVDEYIQDLTQMNDLIVTGPARGGVTPSISVRKEEAQVVGAPPTTEQASAQVAPVSGTVTAVSAIVTPTGAGYLVSWTRPGDAPGTTLYCATLGLPSAKGTAFVLAAESDSADSRDALVQGVVATLQPA